MLLHLEAAFQKLPQDSRFEALIVVKLNNIYIYICEFKLIFKRYGVQSPTTRNNHRRLKNTNQAVVLFDFM